MPFYVFLIVSFRFFHHVSADLIDGTGGNAYNGFQRSFEEERNRRSVKKEDRRTHMKQMHMEQTLKGHGAALLSVVIWGTTFISSKIVLADLSPIELLIYRFAVGLFVLTLLDSHKLVLERKRFAFSGRSGQKGGISSCRWLKQRKDEWYFIFAGLTGVTWYYLLENISLTFTTASNVGVIVSTAPFFTALAAWLLRKEKCLSVRFLTGFILALLGIGMISFQGGGVSLNPLGDFLALCAAFVWGFYSIFSKWISEKGYPLISATKRIIAWGLVFMIPFGFFMGFSFELQHLQKPQVLFHVIYLGVSASALCFVLWNYAVDQLGVITSGVYIYLTPVVTVALSIPVLHETVTWYSGIGMLLTIAGLVISG